MKVEAILSIGYNDKKAIIEIPDEDIEGFVDEDLHDQIMEFVEDWANQYISLGYKIIE